jgi:hypothetical protein
MLNPIAVLGYALKLGSDYAIAVVMLLLLGGLEIIVGGAGSLLFGLIKLPILSSVLSWSIWMMVPMIMAHLLGVLLHTQGDAVGYGDAREFDEPLLKGAVPRGQPPAKVLAADNPRSHAPIELDAPAAPAAPRSYAPIEIEGLDAPAPDSALVGASLDALDMPSPPAAPGEAAPAGTVTQQIEQALAANEEDRALTLYAAQAQPPELTPQQHLVIGQAAVARNQHPLAEKALRAAAKNPAAPETPRAMVLLARVYAEKLGDVETAKKIFSFVVQKFPGTSAAQFASSKLK